MWNIRWLRYMLTAIGIISICAAIWFGLRMTGVDFLASRLLRGGLIATVLGILLIVALVKYLRRRKAARALEESLAEVPQGDGEVLAERMQEALAGLRRSGGATSLYDLPWYVIIGPPGAGKTTALVHSGLEFPGTDKAAVAGFGGTKNCDFWFAEEAVLIDTAGRYTTQDSNEQADKNSWLAFLDQLKQARPNQPINGVILAFSCEDMMTADEAQLDSHALAVRRRLGELHQTLRIDVPVYVIFTKADMIAGFRDYFASFGEERRRAVWGVTFQTKDRTEETYRAVGAEFDGLVSRLSDEVTDRMNEEPDSVSRISIFGLPGQMTLLRGNVEGFLRRVFQKPQETHAILRGFYFTSGTQEGTPIDQVLGAMARGTDGLGGFQPGFMSGKGRSYFLHDLLRKVIFAERDWVGHDLRAMRRRMILRTAMTILMGIVSFGAMGMFGYSFWQNATLVRSAAMMTDNYTEAARDVLAEKIITDPDPRPVLGALAAVRDLPGGYEDTSEQPVYERLGLSRLNGIHKAGLAAYSSALERLLRPRMMLYLENRLPVLLQEKKYEEAYQALKVYILLAKEQPGKPDDAAIEVYFASAWQPYFAELGMDDDFREAKEHLSAMLVLDDRVNPIVKPSPILVTRVQDEIGGLSFAEQAYNVILSRTSGMVPFRLMEAIDGVQADKVFRTIDGSPLDSLTVPGLFTFTGYWSVFREEQENARTRMEEERWVLGERANKVDFDKQLAGLGRDLNARYRAGFFVVWRDMLKRIELVPLADRNSNFASLAIAANEYNSPLLKLAELVDRETRLSRFLDAISAMKVSPEALASGDMGQQLAGQGFNEAQRRSGVLQRILLNSLKNRAKFQGQAAGSADAAPAERRQIEDIERRFEKWHKMVDGDGDTRARPIDVVLASLTMLLKNRQGATRTPSALDERGLQDALAALTQGIAFYPDTMVRFIRQIEREFLTVSANATIDELKRALAENVTAYCEQYVAPAFPFARGGRPISSSAFGEFFGFGGRMDEFYRNRLRNLTERTPDGGLVARAGSDLGARLSPALLKQFGNADRIRQAFFDPGSKLPSVAFSIRQIDASPSVESSQLVFGDRKIELFPNATGASFVWPDDTAEIVVVLLPPDNRTRNGIRFSGGRWSLAEFITRGRNRRSGNRVDVTHQIGGRSITFRLEFDSIEVPFLMRELRDFSCPTNVE